MDDKELDTRKVKINEMEVFLDPDKLHFNEATLTKYFEEEGLHYDFYGHQLVEAEHVMQMLELKYETLYSEKFKNLKNGDGGSDKLVDAKVLSDPEIYDIRKKILLGKRAMRLIQQHLKSWDKTHDNAQNMGHTLRREMDKLQPRIYNMESDLDRVMNQGN